MKKLYELLMIFLDAYAKKIDGWKTIQGLFVTLLGALFLIFEPTRSLGWNLFQIGIGLLLTAIGIAHKIHKANVSKQNEVSITKEEIIEIAKMLDENLEQNK